jgi:hypothetical protein
VQRVQQVLFEVHQVHRFTREPINQHLMNQHPMNQMNPLNPMNRLSGYSAFSPTRKRTNRETVMFSPVLALACATICWIVCELSRMDG